MKYFSVLCTLLLGAAAQMMLKNSSGFASGSFAFWRWFVFSCVLFAAATFANTFVMRLFPVFKTMALISIGTIVFVCAGGMLFFHEMISIRQCIGLVLGSIAIFLIVT
ncbi:MAG: hypothetical protein MdMp014T_2844 [Treponematales bacterium]